MGAPMRMHGKWGTTAAIVVLAAGIALIAAAALRNADRAAARAEAALAAQLLDGYSGKRADLVAAARHIDAALQRDPGCAAAWLEKARWRMDDAGPLDPQALYNASKDLRRGLESQPDHADSYVLLGYVLTRQQRFDEAASAFETARRLGTAGPWLDIHIAAMHLRRDGPAAAEPLYREALADARLATSTRYYAQEQLAQAFARNGDPQRARVLYEELLAHEDARSAWAMGNYSQILRTLLLDVKASEMWGRRALEKMDYGWGRDNLGRTLYLAWAEALIVEKDEAKAARLYAEAEQYLESPSDLLFEMDSHPHAHPIIAALAKRGVPLDYRAELGRDRGTPPLMTLIHNDNVAVAAALLDAGANVDETGDRKTTSLIVAAKFGKVGMTRLLLGRGANLDARNREGQTAEEAARQNGHPETAELVAAERKRRIQGQQSRPPL